MTDNFGQGKSFNKSHSVNSTLKKNEKFESVKIAESILIIVN